MGHLPLSLPLQLGEGPPQLPVSCHAPLDLGNSLEGPGAGIFRGAEPQLVLTEPGKSFKQLS